MRWFQSILASLILTASYAFTEAPAAKSILPEYEKWAADAMESWNVPGMAIGVIQNGELIYQKGFGERKLGSKQPVTSETIFQIGSLSKAFTSTLMAKLVDEKAFNWNDRVQTFDPSFRMWDPWVTQNYEMLDLLAQCSGLPQYAGDSQSALGFSREEMLNHLHLISPIDSFRRSYAYQNIFFLEAAKVFQNVTGKPWEQLLQQKIFTPLEMKSSTSNYTGYIQSSNRAAPHQILPNGKATVIPDTDKVIGWVYTYAPAGGINSNIQDLSHWVQMQINEGKWKGKTLVSNENLRMTHLPHTFMHFKGGKPLYYALGWLWMDDVPRPMTLHTGGTSGSSTVIAMIPEDNIGLIVLTNTAGENLVFALAFEFFDRLYKREHQDWNQSFHEMAKQSQTPSPIQNPYPPMNLKNYEGTYRSSIFGVAEVTARSSELQMKVGPNQTEMTLTPFQRDVFTLNWPYFETDPNTRVSFSLDAQGNVHQMHVESLGKGPEGLFTLQTEEE